MSKPVRKMRTIVLIVCILAPFFTLAQGRLVLNGGKVNITNGAVLVVANSASNAITRTSGHIISEGQNNRIRWSIGTTTGTYSIPWGSGNSNYFPLSFTTSAAAGSGYFEFSTMPTAALNSTTLPTGITHFNGAAGEDMSLFAVDRFWKTDAQSYTTKPTLTNVVFTYQDAEFASPNTTTIENKLTARRWNNTSSTWTDYNTGGTVNTTNNTITIASLSGTNLYPWWTVAYPGTIFHWIPNTTSNWNNAANWSATAAGPGGLGVPGPGDAVWFDDVRDGGCTIDASGEVARITMSTGYAGTLSQGNNTVSVTGNADLSGGTFTGGTGAITINGNLTLSGVTFTSTSGVLDLKQQLNLTAGTFNHNNGTVRFSGTTGTQQIAGTVTGTFNNINVTNISASPGLRLESNVNLAGVLSLSTNVVVDADGAANNKILTLLSTSDNPTADAAIGILPAGASVTGNVTVQRFMSQEGAGNRLYRYIGSPVQGATVADLQQEIPVTGTFTGTSPCSGCNTASPSMYVYHESLTGDVNKNGVITSEDGWIEFPDNTNTEIMEPGRGYLVYVRGNLLTTAKWDVRGVINAGNVTPVSLPVSYTNSGNSAIDGWNMVSNPFPSTIDWNAASGWTKTNITGSFYTRDNGNAISRFATWNGVVGTNGGSRYIATGQAVWVKANGNGTPVLQVNENVKAPGTQTTFFRAKAISEIMRITLVQGTNSDETIIHFREDASEDFDINADAIKMLNSGINLSTQIDGRDKLAINSLSKTSCHTSLRLLVEYAANGNYSLNFSDLQSFPASTTIVLHDAFTGARVNIRQQDTYAFVITADVLSKASTRFSLSIDAVPANTEFAATAAAVCTGTNGQVVLTGTNEASQYQAFINEEQIAFAEEGSDTLTWAIPQEKLQPGNNNLVIRATPYGCGTVHEKHIVLNVAGITSPSAVSGGSVCREGVVLLSSAGAPEGSTYRWYETETALTPLFESAYADFTTPVLNASKIYFTSIANVLGCEGERIPVTAEVVQFTDAEITAAGDSLQVNFNDGVQWYFNDEMLEGEQSALLFPEAFGTYRVRVTIGSCTTEASYLRTEEITGIETELSNAIQVYPNPVVRELSLNVSPQVHVREAIVRNALGQYIGKIKIVPSPDTLMGKFDMTTQQAGLYLIEIISDEGKALIKVVKE
ncbi:MAG TPA: hypothetical protein VGK59_18935 [Ohtaekwangia sp.]